jgi:hypothetical protein
MTSDYETECVINALRRKVSELENRDYDDTDTYEAIDELDQRLQKVEAFLRARFLEEYDSFVVVKK